MIMIVIVVSFTPMILVTGVILNQFHSSYQEKIHAHLGELVLKHKQNIDGFLQEKLSDIRLLSRSLTPDKLNDGSFLQQKLRELQREYGGVFEDLGIVSARGLQTAYAGPFDLTNALYSEADWFKNAINSEFYISDVFLGLRESPHFIVSVRRTTQGRSWILRATINFMAFNTLVENLRIGRTGFAFVLNRNGVLQTKAHADIADSLPGEETYHFFLKKSR